jgi:hypothetical protein
MGINTMPLEPQMDTESKGKSVAIFCAKMVHQKATRHRTKDPVLVRSKSVFICVFLWLSFASFRT